MNPQNLPDPSATSAAGPGDSSTETSGSATKDKIVQTARETATKVKDTASSTALRAKEEASRYVSEKKEVTANRIGSYSSAIHDTARSLEEKDPNIAWFTHQAADRLQGIADYMRNRDFSALRQDAENLARRHPATFFGGMFLAGLIVGNIVKASRRKLDENNEYGSDYQSDWSAKGSEVGMQPELTDTERSSAGF